VKLNKSASQQESKGDFKSTDKEENTESQNKIRKLNMQISEIKINLQKRIEENNNQFVQENKSIEVKLNQNENQIAEINEENCIKQNSIEPINSEIENSKIDTTKKDEVIINTIENDIKNENKDNLEEKLLSQDVMEDAYQEVNKNNLIDLKEINIDQDFSACPLILDPTNLFRIGNKRKYQINPENEFFPKKISSNLIQDSDISKKEEQNSGSNYINKETQNIDCPPKDYGEEELFIQNENIELIDNKKQ